MNVVMHSESGVLSFEIDNNKVTLEVSDKGPDIEDVESAMKEGFSTASDECREMGFGAGMGLPNIQKNADDLTIESAKDAGTHVRMLFYITKEREDEPL